MRPSSSRRGFLRGAGGALIGLPWLEALAPRPARAAEPPSRFLVLYSPNGHPLSHFRAPPGAADPLDTPILAPLAGLRDRLLVLEGIGLRSAGRLGHECIGSLLTGTYPGGGRSLDQEMVGVLGSTRIRSLELGISVPAAPAARVHLSFNGNNQPRPAASDPRVVFDQIFPGGSAGPPLDVRLARRRSILDGIKANLDQTLLSVSSLDREVIFQHLQKLREVETALGQAVPLVCAPRERPGAVELTNHAAADMLATVQTDLLRLALACDATRVATFMLGEAGCERTFRFLGVGGDDPRSSWVGLSHRTDTASQQSQAVISKWCAERLNQLAGALASIPEAGGTALDRTLILWMTECHPDHTVDDLPLALLAGRRFTTVKAGRVARFPDGTSHNDLLLSMLALVGSSKTSFGNPAFCKGPLSLA